MDDLRRALLQLILDKPEISSSAIREHSSMKHEDSTRISQTLFAMKKSEHIVADEARRYTITAKGRTYLKDGKEETAPERKTPHKSSPPLSPEQAFRRAAAQGDGVEQILVEAEANAQGALDRYLTTVGDPNIIGPLRAARDSAREALKNYRESEEE